MYQVDTLLGVTGQVLYRCFYQVFTRVWILSLHGIEYYCSFYSEHLKGIAHILHNLLRMAHNSFQCHNLVTQQFAMNHSEEETVEADVKSKEKVMQHILCYTQTLVLT